MTDGENTLRSALTRLVDGLEIDALLFTTFTFDPEFFESNVLPVITGVEHVATIRELQFVSEEAERLGVVVFHDGRARGRRTKRATYPTVPIYLENGVFHPKLVVASGTSSHGHQTRVLVSSANLTFAGWGRQREAVAMCEADHTGVTQPLTDLLAWLAENMPDSEDVTLLLERVLGRLAQNSQQMQPDAANLEISLPAQGEPAASYLAATSGPVTIAAPYFSPGFTGWLERVLPNRAVTLVPAAHGDEIDLLQSELATLASSAHISFARIADADADRFDHLKLLHAGGRLWLGSHNATMAALGSDVDVPALNVEVSLSVPCAQFPFALEPLDPLPMGKSQEQKSEEREQLLSSSSTWSFVVLHWAASEFRVDVGSALAGYSIQLPGIHERVIFETAVHRFVDAEKVAEALQNRRVFRVWDAEDELVHEGFVNETGWRHARPVGCFASLGDCFDAWRSRKIANASAANIRLLGEANDHDIEEMLQLDAVEIITTDLLETYFSFFRAVRGLRESLARAAQSESAHADAIMMQFLERAPGSLREAHRHIDEGQNKAEDAELVFWFVVVHELAKLATEAEAWAAQWPHVRGCARRLREDLAAASQARAAKWFDTTVSADRERLSFILTALEYEGANGV